MEFDVFSADQLLLDHSEQEGIHAFLRTMIASTSPAGRVFELSFTNLCLSSRRTIYGPDDVASSTPQHLELVGPDRTYGSCVPRRTRRVLDRTNLAISQVG